MICYACYCRFSAMRQEHLSAHKVPKCGPQTLQTLNEACILERLLQPITNSWCQVSQLKCWRH